MSLVSFVNNKSDTIPSFKRAISDSLDLIGYSFTEEIRNIVVKPNMCYYWDHTTGKTTDPRFVAALIEVLRERISPEPNISVVESDASAMKCKFSFKMLGYEQLSQDYNVKLVNLSEDVTRTVEATAGDFKLKLQVPKTIQDADLKINVPKIKYSVPSIKMTCALKNIFGCNPYPKKFKYHPQIAEVIVALNKAYDFNLCIIDGNIVSGVQPCRLGLVMASRDSVAIDAASAKIAGINPKKVTHLQLAAKENLGSTQFIQKGIPLDYFKARYPRKNINKMFREKAFEFITFMGLEHRLGL